MRCSRPVLTTLGLCAAFAAVRIGLTSHPVYQCKQCLPLKPNDRVGELPLRARHAEGGMYGYVMSLLSRFFRSADLYKNLLVHLVPFGR